MLNQGKQAPNQTTSFKSFYLFDKQFQIKKKKINQIKFAIFSTKNIVEEKIILRGVSRGSKSIDWLFSLQTAFH